MILATYGSPNYIGGEVLFVVIGLVILGILIPICLIRWIFRINVIVTELERSRRELTEIHNLLQAQAERAGSEHGTEKRGDHV